MPDASDITGLELNNGTYEEAQEWVGRTGPTFYAPEPMSGTLIRYFAAMVEDGTPLYWDEKFATRTAGDLCAPPGLLLSMQTSPIWRPSGDTGSRRFRYNVPLPAEKDKIVAVKADTKYYRRLYRDDRLNFHERVDDVSDEKETRLGRGHFITTTTVFNDQTGETVAENTFTSFRYVSADESDESVDAPAAEGRRLLEVEDNPEREAIDRYESVDAATVAAGDDIPALPFPLTYKRIIQDAAATLDFYPGHHDPDFAQDQGNETLYFNTMGLQGLVDRFVLEWAGPEWRLENRVIEISGSALAGDILTLQGSVDSVDPATGTITVDCGIYREGTEIIPATVTITTDE